MKAFKALRLLFKNNKTKLNLGISVFLIWKNKIGSYKLKLTIKNNIRGAQASGCLEFLRTRLAAAMTRYYRYVMTI